SGHATTSPGGIGPNMAPQQYIPAAPMARQPGSINAATQSVGPGGTSYTNDDGTMGFKSATPVQKPVSQNMGQTMGGAMNPPVSAGSNSQTGLSGFGSMGQAISGSNGSDPNYNPNPG